MNWYYAENNQKQGPVGESEFEQLAREGKITPDTLVWREGMATWQSYREAVIPPFDGAPPLPGDAGAGNEDAPVVSQGRDGPSWENRANLGLLNALVETIKGVLLEPTETFSRMKREGGIGAPLQYALLVGGIGTYAGVIYNVIYGYIRGYPLIHRDFSVEYIHRSGAYAGFLLIFMVFFLPLAIGLGTLVYSALLHLCLMLLGGAKQPFETTFRVVCYSFGSNAVWQIIPLCGSYIWLVWLPVVACIGIAKAHEISTLKAVAAVLLPLFCCCCFATVLLMFAIGTLFPGLTH